MNRAAPVRAAVLAAITEHGPMSTVDLAEMLGCSVNGARRALQHWTLHPRRLRIVDWTRSSRDSSPPYPVYGLGSGKHKPRPKPITNAERCARYKRRRAMPAVVPAAAWIPAGLGVQP